MEQLPSDPEYLHLPAGSTPPDLETIPRRIVVVIEQDVTQEWREQISEWIVRLGCLYMMAWGNECSKWDDSVDIANLEAFNYADIPDDAFVMTTWHEREPIEEAFWFCRTCAHHPTIDLPAVLIVDISPVDRREALIGEYWTELSD